MGKYVRIGIAVVIVLGIVFLARNQAAWAANPKATTGSSGQAQIQASPASQGDVDCSKAENKDKDKCKDKDKDKCKDKKGENCGTVQPPANDIEVCQVGDYSVGGNATLAVEKLKDGSQKDDCFHAQSQDSSSVSGLPQNAGSVLSDLIVLTSVGQGSSITICFAAVPDKKVTIYYSETDAWKPVGTQVKNGMACAHVSGSGSFVLAGQ